MRYVARYTLPVDVAITVAAADEDATWDALEPYDLTGHGRDLT